MKRQRRVSLETQGTLLAAERTFLSYIRTGFTFIAGGVVLIPLFNIVPFLVMLPMGILTIVGGGMRYWRLRQTIVIVRRPARKR